jgi:hypothetical protein
LKQHHDLKPIFQGAENGVIKKSALFPVFLHLYAVCFLMEKLIFLVTNFNSKISLNTIANLIINNETFLPAISHKIAKKQDFLIKSDFVALTIEFTLKFSFLRQIL